VSRSSKFTDPLRRIVVTVSKPCTVFVAILLGGVPRAGHADPLDAAALLDGSRVVPVAVSARRVFSARSIPPGLRQASAGDLRRARSRSV